MSANQHYADAASRILTHQGDQAADAKRASGAIWGNAARDLGDIGAKAVSIGLEQHKERQISAIFKEHGGDLATAIPKVMAIDPKLGTELGKHYADAQKAAFEYQTKQHEAKLHEFTFLANLLGSATDDTTYAKALVTAQMAGIDVTGIDPTYSPETVAGYNRQLMTAQQRFQASQPKAPEPFKLGPGDKQFDATGKLIAENEKAAATPSDYTLGGERRSGATNEVIATAPPSAAGGAGFSLAPGGTRFDAQGNVVAHLPDRPPSAGGSAEDKVLVPIIGPDGKPVLVPRSQAVGKTPASAGGGGGARVTGAQNKVLGFFNRAKQADDDLQGLEAQIAKKGYFAQAWMNNAPNVAQSAEGQRYTQAQRAFTEARLRKDSGAAIPPQEFENDRLTYFVQAGDNDATIAQKARARAAMLASMAFESGGALEGFYGEEAAGMLDSFRTRSGKGGTAPTPAPTSGTVQARDPQGKLHTAPAGKALPPGWTWEPKR